MSKCGSLRRMRRICGAMIAVVALVLTSAVADAQESVYEFQTAPGEKQNIIWRVDRLSGEVGMCFFERSRRNPVGLMTCPERGAGAGVQNEPGPFGLIASRQKDDRGIFRVNRRTGTLSLCYELDDRKGHRIVCTEPNR